MSQVIEFKQITLQNFMSYGNKPTTLDIEKGIHLITGLNGRGKSTLFIALYYCLYGKTHKGNKLVSLINDINNSDCLVSVDFSIDKNTYRVTRGQKPNKFLIYKNGEQLPTLSSITEQQNFLEHVILKLPESSFKQLIYLGGDVITSSFVNLSKKEKEEMFELLADTSIFKVLLERIKLKDKELTTQETNLVYKNNLLYSNLEEATKIYSTQLNVWNETQEKIKKLSEKSSKQLDDLKEEEKKILEGLVYAKNINEQKKSLVEKLASMESKLSEFNQEISRLKNLEESNRKIKEVFKGCIGCEKLALIKSVNIDSLNTSYEDDIQTLVKKQLKLSSMINDEKETLDTYNSIINEGSSQFSILQKIRKEIALISEEVPIEVPKPTNDHIIKFEKEYKSSVEDLKKVKEKKAQLKKVETLLSGDNLKGFIMKNNLPMINSEVNNFIQKFSNFDFSFLLDSSLSESIYKGSKQIEYKSMSNGQAMRLSISIMAAFLSCIQKKHGVETNILVMDEFLDSHLDAEGRVEILQILKEQFINRGVYIISHNDTIKDASEFFSSYISIEKQNGFSKLTKL